MLTIAFRGNESKEAGDVGLQEWPFSFFFAKNPHEKTKMGAVSL